MSRLMRFVRYFHFQLPEKEKEHFARKLVGFSTEEMYSVVSDVGNYKNFIPFCSRSTILSKSTNKLSANLEIGFSLIVENYTSEVTLSKPNLVRAVCTDGNLFDYLETTFKFSPGLKSNPRSCIIDFYICFSLVHKMETAFLDEAKSRFGVASLPSHPLEVVKT